MAEGSNTFVWYDLVTTDREAALAFYRHVVGWTAAEAGLPGSDYTILSADRPVGGAVTLPPEVASNGGKPGWLGYIGVPDLDGAVERLRGSGGAVHRPASDIPGIGRFAVVADPHGAVFVLFQPASGGSSPAAPMTPGHVGWHELYAGDGPDAFRFYADQFGWAKGDAMDMGPMGTYQIFTAGGPPVGAIMTKPPQVPRPAWGFYFVVPAIDAAVERVKDGGGQVVSGPMEVPGGSWIIGATDPQGANFALVAPGR